MLSFASKLTKGSTIAVALATIAALTAAGTPTLAQGGQPGGRPSISVQAFNACTTTNYADIAAKALGTTAATLRKDIVSGQSLQDIAAGANISLQTVTDALQAARKIDIDQAVTDGVITQDEATALEAPVRAPGTPPASDGTRPAPSGTRPANAANGQNGPNGPNGPFAPFPDISTIHNLLQVDAVTPAGPGNGPRGGGGFFGFGNGLFNRVKQYYVAAQALNMKCADLVKTLITPPGKSVASVASDQKIDPQTISDALTKAYKDALAQDVTDGIITQAQSDQLSPIVDKAVSTFVANPLPMGVQATPAK